MNITIIGGGNIGCTLATKFSLKANVTLFVGSNNDYRDYIKNMKIINPDTNSITVANISKITESLEDSLKEADYVFITYPQFLFEKLAKDMFPFVKKGTHLVFVPGSGGAEFWFKHFLDKQCTITGLQRVHCVARIIDKGKSVKECGVKKSLKIASIPNSFNKEAKNVLEELYNLPIELLHNYANITLINSNSILHTSRLYCLFKNYTHDLIYNYIPLFYEEWDMESAEVLAKLDNELQEILQVLSNNDMDMSGIIDILTYYDSTNTTQLKNKLCSISGFKGIKTPSVELTNGFKPDFESRYFIADFPYGLDIILSFAEICGTKKDTLQLVSNWYYKITNTHRVFNLNQFNINNLNDIISFYK